jgi:hypothetical protein
MRVAFSTEALKSRHLWGDIDGTEPDFQESRLWNCKTGSERQAYRAKAKRSRRASRPNRSYSDATQNRRCAYQVSKVIRLSGVWKVIDANVRKEASDEREWHQHTVQKTREKPGKTGPTRHGLGCAASKGQSHHYEQQIASLHNERQMVILQTSLRLHLPYSQMESNKFRRRGILRESRQQLALSRI